MPKGRMGISGSGPFRSVQLPKHGKRPRTQYEKQLQALDAIKNELLDELEERRSSALAQPKRKNAGDEIVAAIGTYLGQTLKEKPPTEAERDKILKKIESAACKLEKQIVDAPFHVKVLLHNAMRCRGGDIDELKKQLTATSVLMPISQWVKTKKGRPDPFAEDLIRELVIVWQSTTGEWPGKTGQDHYKGGRTSPFYIWVNRIAKVGIGKKLPRELIDTTIGLTKPDGQISQN